MKVLSVIVPSYNSEAYIHRAMKSLLVEKERVEVIIVNDGSTDSTGKIADTYAKDYPQTVKVIHQENGGHGEAVNTGITHATGVYVKVVDSDDWVDTLAYKEVLNLLTKFSEDEKIDMFISNYVYEKRGAWHKKAVRYTSSLPQNRVFGWDEVKFPKGKYLLMHSVIYRRSLLRESGIKLPKHTFYVDNIFVFEPLTYVKRLYYLNVDFYRYFIGREDQSVNEKKMIAQIDQQIFVNKKIIDHYINTKETNTYLKAYMFHFLEIITLISSVLLLKINTEESRKKKEELWLYMQSKDEELYQRMKGGFFGLILSKHSSYVRYFAVNVYKACQKIYGFN